MNFVAADFCCYFKTLNGKKIFLMKTTEVESIAYLKMISAKSGLIEKFSDKMESKATSSFFFDRLVER